MRLLHKIQYGRDNVLILKYEPKEEPLGKLVAFEDSYFALDCDMVIAGEDPIKELKDMGATVIIPIMTNPEDEESEVLALYVYFNDKGDFPDLVDRLNAEIASLLRGKYTMVLKNRRSGKEREKVHVSSIAGVQKVLDKLKVPFEFTADEELCCLRKNKAKHTKRRTFARCKYYKTSSGEYVLFKRFKD